MVKVRLWVGALVVGLLLVNMGQSSAATLERGPYLQMTTPTSIIVRWRTDLTTDSVVRYGDTPGNLTSSTSLNPNPLVTDHEVTVTGLLPDTRYYYSVGSSGEILSGGDTDHFFATAPVAGTAKPTRVWVIGDAGTGNSNAAAVRDAYEGATGSATTDLWLMLGDNAYPDGTDGQYQTAVFDFYTTMLRNTVVWPTLGNHDGHTADSATQSGAYYEIFSLPTDSGADGFGSGTEAYYSFDYGNIHFVCLESYETDRSASGAMMTWLEEDLAANDKEWTIAFWHHPPYTKGSHDSDTESRLIEMRQNALPILESYGVDLVLSGHSHSYERSHLLDGHYGSSTTLTPAMVLDAGGGHEDGAGAYDKPEGGAAYAGAVYAVAGSSGKISGGSLNHPAMFISLNSLGSMILEINANRLDVSFLDAGGVVADYFTITKGPDITGPGLVSAVGDDSSTVTVHFSEPLNPASAATVANYTLDNGVSITQATLAANGKSVVLNTSPLVEGVLHTLTVNNVTDLAGNPIPANSQTQFTFVTVITKSFQDGVAPSAGYSGTRDTFIAENEPVTNFGNDVELLVDGDDPGNTDRDLSTLFLWDLSDIPNDAPVEGATITIEVTNASSKPYELYELKVNWQEDGATWNSYATGSPWAIAGAFGASDSGSTVLGTVNGGSVGNHTITLNQEGLDLLQAWVEGSAPNYGFIITNETSSDGLDFSSREVIAPLDRPMLTVTYSLPPAGDDLDPPEPPNDLQMISTTATTAMLTWQPCANYPSQPCDNVGVAGYKVYRDTALVGTPTAPTFEDTGLTANTTYSYDVSSFDAANNESPYSAPLAVTTDPAFTSNCTGLACDFVDGHGSSVSWSWDFGDGGASTLQDPSHSYAAAGTYSVTLTAIDGEGGSDTTSQDVTLSAPAVNQAPVANAQNVGTDENSAVAITLTGSDADGDSLTFAMASGPSNGALSGTAPNLTYTPNPGFSGTDGFTFTANDGKEDSAPAAVSITVTANLPPSAVASANPGNPATNAMVTVESAGSADADGSISGYAWSWVTKPAGSLASFGNENAASTSFTADVAGFYEVQLMVTDDDGDSAIDTRRS